MAHWVSRWQRKPRGETQLKEVSYRDCLRNRTPTAAIQCHGVFPIPNIRHQLWDGKQHQRKRGVVDMGLTAEDCEARATLSIRPRPARTLLFAIVPTHTKSKYRCANLLF